MIKPGSSRKPVARPRGGCLLAMVLLASLPVMRVTPAAGLAATCNPNAIPWNQIGARAGRDNPGAGLAVTATESGARLHCGCQRLDAEATPGGLSLTSTVTHTASDCFQVTAMAIGRIAGDAAWDFPAPASRVPLAGAGQVTICGQTVRFRRAGLTEEYSVSLDGVRQDFIVEEPPAGPPSGELRVELAVSGARVEPAADGARLVLNHSGRKLAYRRLRVTDATGKELPARIQVCPVEEEVPSLISTSGRLSVVVDDGEAVYPLRIDPTFSDANWVGIRGLPDGDLDVAFVSAVVVDGSGNLYVGGVIDTAGGVPVNNVAEWNGSSWSALGSGMDGGVAALAVSGGTLFAGGYFTTAGGIAANNIAQWNGSSWSALGSGMSTSGSVSLPNVSVLAVSGGTLFAGGYFTTIGGVAANNIAQWDGNSWSALGSGTDGSVAALALSGGTLYAGGYFYTAGGVAASHVAQWNGSNWSALGLGFNEEVLALVVSGGTLYAGGGFSKVGVIPKASFNCNCIAQWDGHYWTPLGLGVGDNDPSVNALAVSGGTLYVGGNFTSAGLGTASYIAQWDGNTWSALGSGMNGDVAALAVSGGKLYAGGDFTTAGGNTSTSVAQAWLPGALAILTANADFGLTGGAFGFDVIGPAGSNVVIQASPDLQTWIPLQTNQFGIDLLHFSDPQSTTNVQRFYRAQLLF